MGTMAPCGRRCGREVVGQFAGLCSKTCGGYLDFQDFNQSLQLLCSSKYLFQPPSRQPAPRLLDNSSSRIKSRNSSGFRPHFSLFSPTKLYSTSKYVLQIAQTRDAVSKGKRRAFGPRDDGHRTAERGSSISANRPRFSRAIFTRTPRLHLPIPSRTRLAIE